ncbi:flagellar hook capping protein [Sulfobacillus thermotolerans]|uniref:Flagellar hook capping protein n=1 Tax=Sulfobacillus thermotolerans TaxID=338644 RepID=A0ABN5H2R3_9FIRM|nr:flagellar hook capping protein [Sulfobacillus thermotolerans]
MSSTVNSLSSLLTPQASSQATGSATSPSSSPSSNLGESAFLTLLSAELQYQNPLQPMDNTQFVAQLAQFSALAATTTQTSTLNSILSTLQQQNPVVAMAQLIGKTVTTTQGSGTVSAVSQQGQSLMADINGVGTVPISDITEVQN